MKLHVEFEYVDSTQNFIDPVIVNIGLVEDNIGTTPHRNVLRKLLLGTDGRLITKVDWTTNPIESIDSETEIDVPIGLDNNNLYLIAFVQDRITKRIHQAVIKKINDKSGSVIVGIDDPVLNGAQAIQIFPNPASRYLNFTSEYKLMDGYTYSIVDQRGVTVLEWKTTARYFHSATGRPGEYRKRNILCDH